MSPAAALLRVPPAPAALSQVMMRKRPEGLRRKDRERRRRKRKKGKNKTKTCESSDDERKTRKQKKEEQKKGEDEVSEVITRERRKYNECLIFAI